MSELLVNGVNNGGCTPHVRVCPVTMCVLTVNSNLIIVAVSRQRRTAHNTVLTPMSCIQSSV